MIAIPDAVQPIFAWRLWAVRQGHLGSVAVHEVWPPRTSAVARCWRPGSIHAAPDAACTCGLHGLRSTVTPSRAVVTRGLFPHMESVAFGRVALWGRVDVHVRGYRAQYAYPVWVRVLDASEALCGSLRDAYGIPVVSCAFQRTLERRIMSSLADPGAAPRLAAAAITYHSRRDRLGPMGLVNCRGRWRPALGLRAERCEQCRSATRRCPVSARLAHYRSADHIASLYRLPASLLHTATQILEEIDAALCSMIT